MSSTKERAALATAATAGEPAGCNVAAWLASRGVKHSKLVAIPLSSINERESRSNQARREALDEETVARYAEAYKSGEVLPPVVVRVVGDGPKVAVIDGNHRHGGARRARRPEVLGYVVAADTPTAIIKLLTVEANSRHGLKVDTAWRHAQAAMLSAEGFGTDAVARALAVTEAWVKDSLKLSRVDNRAAELKVRGWEDLAVTARQALSAISSDPVFAEAARMVVETGFGAGKPLGDFVRDLRAQRSEQDQLKMVGAVYEERSTARRLAARQGRGTKLPSYRNRVATALGQVMGIEPGLVPANFTTPVEMTELHDRCERAVERLFEIMEVLDRRATELSA